MKKRKTMSRRQIRKILLQEYKSTITENILVEKRKLYHNKQAILAISKLERMGYTEHQINESFLEKAGDIANIGSKIMDITGFDLGDLGLDSAKDWLAGKISEFLGIEEGSPVETVVMNVISKFSAMDAFNVVMGKANCEEMTRKIVNGLSDALLALGLEHINRVVSEHIPVAGMLFDNVEDVASDLFGFHLVSDDPDLSSPISEKLYDVLGEKIEKLVCRGKKGKVKSSKSRASKIRSKSPKEMAPIKEMYVYSAKLSQRKIEKMNKQLMLL